MPTTTTNFGWTVPSDTDLVKDGAAAIRTALGGPDTSFVDLKGGTTGQVLSKASGTDLDFTWVTQDDSNAIQNAIVDAKGDLITATAADTPARLAVGTNGYVLTADSAAATGIKWAAPAAGGKVLQVVSTFKSDAYTTSPNVPSYTDVTGLSVSITPSSTSSRILVLYNVAGISEAGVSAAFFRLVRGSTAINQGDASGSRTLGFGNTYQGATSDTIEQLSGTFVDSPSTTSATTYKIQVTCGGILYINRSASDSNASYGMRVGSSITVMEIGA